MVRRDGVELTEEDVKQYVRENLARYKVPRDVGFLDELPRNPTGKVLKRELGESLETTQAVMIVNTTRDEAVVCARAEVADTIPRRLRGLLGRASLGPGEGMLFRGESSIHSAFMRFRFDAVFMDRELRVVGLAERIPPWRVRAARGARNILELAAWRNFTYRTCDRRSARRD